MIAGAGYRDSVPHLVADPACAERDGAEPVLHCIVLYRVSSKTVPTL